MGIQASGRARVEQEVVDLSVLINTGLKGVHAVIGVTEKGPVGKSRLIGSWLEFRKYYGGLLATDLFPLICRRALEAGVKLRVVRAVHYTDIADANSATGTIATAAQVGGDNVVFNSANVGIWGNSVSVEVVAAQNGVAGEFDINITVAGDSLQNTTVRNIKGTLDAAAIAKFNNGNNLVVIPDTEVGGALAAESITLGTGTDSGAVVATDITGDSAAVTGIHALDNAVDFSRVSAPSYALPVVDAKLIQYAETRQDCRAILRTPTGISGNTGVDYRNGTGAYAHTAYNSWYASMVFGGLEISHPETGVATVIPALADVMGNYAQKDQKAYEWFSAAGSKRGKIRNAEGIDYNLGSSARSTEADNVDVNGINPVISHNAHGLVYWGNSTLQKTDTLLKHENVADLVVLLNRSIPALASTELFEPNDVETWRAIHRKVRPLLELIKTRRGIWDYLYQGDHLINSIEELGEGSVNTPDAVDAGKYEFIIWIKPKVGLKYIGIRYSLTNSGVSFEGIQTEQ